jgi:hypothetical protein
MSSLLPPIVEAQRARPQAEVLEKEKEKAGSPASVSSASNPIRKRSDAARQPYRKFSGAPPVATSVFMPVVSAPLTPLGIADDDGLAGDSGSPCPAVPVVVTPQPTYPNGSSSPGHASLAHALSQSRIGASPVSSFSSPRTSLTLPAPLTGSPSVSTRSISGRVSRTIG